MDFSRRKLPKEAALNLRICPIASVKPYALMLAPVYVFMKANEKFVSVKAPLDFFTPEELERLKTFESFFLPAFVDSALPFRQTARQVRALIGWQPKKEGAEQLPPAPYEISDAVLRLIGPLWGAGAVIEPFFVAVFANEICDLLPDDRLRAARDQNVDGYERAILRSAWAVFLALHLGYCDLGFLNSLRTRVFEASLLPEGKVTAIGRGGEIDELIEIVWASIEPERTTPIQSALFSAHSSRAAQKMVSRLKRVRGGMIQEDQPVPTIHGERGFVDV